VPAGGNVTLVAHLAEGEEPTITPFVNDVSSVPTGQARVVVRQSAAPLAIKIRIVENEPRPGCSAECAGNVAAVMDADATAAQIADLGSRLAAITGAAQNTASAAASASSSPARGSLQERCAKRLE
jgi:hypothetical protein